MPREYEFLLVDAFSRSAFSGNVAGVILDARELSDQQMQSIASEFNASETTFVLPPTTGDAAIRFRWFTPGVEVRFCGHATIAGVHALRETDRLPRWVDEDEPVLRIETLSGIVPARIEESPDLAQPCTVWLDMPHCAPKKIPVNITMVCKNLGITPGDLDPEFPAFRTGDDDIMLAVRSIQTLLEMQPPMGELKRYCEQNRLRGVFVTTRQTLSKAVVVQSRFFAPAAGIDEDPVTGSAHGPLGLHLVEHGIVHMNDGRADFHCAQAKAGGRAGLVRVVVSESHDGSKSVRIGGTCITTTRGTITV
jgi:trans-2,3-dihydro-3-hydroxyanthranilate isomerase